MSTREWVVPLFSALMLTGCGPSAADRLEANKELVRQFAAVLNAADWDGLGAGARRRR